MNIPPTHHDEETGQSMPDGWCWNCQGVREWFEFSETSKGPIPTEFTVHQCKICKSKQYSKPKSRLEELKAGTYKP